ncbi:MAG: nucleotidyltransferase domain-containing protein [Desulfuromonadales bacterium]
MHAQIDHEEMGRLQPLIRVLESDEAILFAYLFGSRARGEQTPLSDIDLAVYCRPLENAADYRLDLFDRLGSALGSTRLDLVLLNFASLSLSGRILRDRLLLVDNEPSVRHAYESLTLREFWDFQRFEQMVLERRFDLG